MKSGGLRPSAVANVSSRTPAGINLGIGAAMIVGAGLVAALIPTNHTGWRFTVIALAVGLFAALTGDQLALVGVALLGWLVVNGFLEGRLGELSWHGSSDIWLMMVLVIAAALGLAVGEAGRQIRELSSRWRAEVEGSGLVPDLVEEERARDA